MATKQTKKKPKTEAEIIAEIQKLKDIRPKVRPTSFFGDNNLAGVDAMIRVLEERMDEDKVYGVFEGDPDNEEYESDIDLVNTALDAVRWMKGEHDTPSLVDGLPLKG